MELKIEETAMQHNFQATKQVSLLTIALPRGFLLSAVYIMRFSDSFASKYGTQG
jgi:hypothetical protein